MALARFTALIAAFDRAGARLCLARAADVRDALRERLRPSRPRPRMGAGRERGGTGCGSARRDSEPSTPRRGRRRPTPRTRAPPPGCRPMPARARPIVLAQRVIRLLLAGADPGAHPLPDLHQGRGGRDGEARLRRSSPTGRRSPTPKLAARDRRRSRAAGPTRRRSPTRGGSSPARWRRRAASRSRPSTPSASACSTSSPSRPMSPAISRCSTSATPRRSPRRRAADALARAAARRPTARSARRSHAVLALGQRLHASSAAMTEFDRRARPRPRAGSSQHGSLDEALADLQRGARPRRRRGRRAAPRRDRRRMRRFARRRRGACSTGCRRAASKNDQDAAERLAPYRRRRRATAPRSTPISTFWTKRPTAICASRRASSPSAVKNAGPASPRCWRPSATRLARAARPPPRRRAATTSTAAMLRLADARHRRLRAAEDGARRPRLRGPRRQDRGAARPRRRLALGPLQARPRPRPHPRRRGAGHQPAPVAGGQGAGRGVLRRRGRERARSARSSPSATRSSRSSPSRARCRPGSRACGASSAAAPARAGLAWSDPELHLSFRSVPVVLEAVDAVFASETAHRGLAAEPGPTDPHRARGATCPAGSILWPMIEPPAKTEPEDWATPVDHLGEESPEVQLANRIADTIARLARPRRAARRDRRADPPRRHPHPRRASRGAPDRRHQPRAEDAAACRSPAPTA